MATAPSPNDLTRQQLDELDALLQRMLSVPLAAPDTPMPAPAPPRTVSTGPAGPPLPPIWRVDPPTSAAGVSAPHLALPEPPSAQAIALEVPPSSVPRPTASKPVAVPPSPSPPVPKPAAEAVPPVPPLPVPKPAAEAVPPAAPLPVSKPVGAPPLAPAPTTTTGITPAPAAPPVPLPLLPLVALNALFDNVFGRFGGPGRVLRSGFFKHIYGAIGLGLLLYTAAHVAHLRGWIALPVPLPWPR